MTPLFIKSIVHFIQETKGLWIGLAILAVILAFIGLVILALVTGHGEYLVILIPVAMFLMMSVD